MGPLSTGPLTAPTASEFPASVPLHPEDLHRLRFPQTTCCPAAPAPFLTHFPLAVWAEVGGNFQGKREEDNEDPEVFCPLQAAAFMYFRSTQEISQKPAAFNS